jgi:hypothetical protein
MKRLAGMVVITAAGLALAACSSSTSTASSSASASSSAAAMSGTETITGRVTGKAALANASTIPLKLTGPVTTTSTITLNNSSSKVATFKTADGNLVVSHTGGKNSGKLVSTSTCKFVGTTAGVTYTVLGSQSTGKFKGATGHGTAAIVFGGDLPKKSNGKCNTSNSAEPSVSTAYVTFTARGPLTLQG